MRNVSVFGVVATTMAALALVVAIVALVLALSASGEGESDNVEIYLLDRAEFTIDLVFDAVERYGEEGREATFAYYNSPESVKGQWYVFLVDEDCTMIAHTSQALLGRDLKGDLGVDVSCYRFGDAILGATEQSLWVDYVFFNPVTGNQEFKHSWVTKHDGLIFGSGFYQVLPSSPLDVTKAAPAEYTIAVVERAVRFYKAYGRARAVDYFNSPESLDGEWYVFLIDEDGQVIAHVDQSLVGKDMAEVVEADIEGNDLKEILAGVTEAGRWVHYRSRNADGAEQIKHMWLVRHDGILIGSDRLG